MTVGRDPGGRLTYDEPDYGDEGGFRVAGRAEAGPVSPFGGARHPDPCSVVMFGVTGDLAHRKLIPALYDLGCHGVLPAGTTLVGYGRRELSDAQFRDLLQGAIDDHYGVEGVDGDVCRLVLEAPRYVQGEFDDPEGFARLAALLDELDRQGSRGNRMFYLATPPSQFPVLVEQLGAAGLARPGAGRDPGGPRGWTRVVIEKPFGRDLETARELDRVIGQVFDERQVYRIDHYLAKETVQNLLVLRFANVIFEPVWNRRYVDYVEITAAETLGVEHRGPYYEEAGALRDMITPHLIQLFSLVAMEPPVAFDADAVRDEKMKVLRAVRPIPPESIADWAVRAQYVSGVVDGEEVPGYRDEERVAPDSYTETYAALKLVVDNWRWQGVPFYLRTGKRMARRVTEIAIHFKRPPVLLFKDAMASGGLQPNVLVLRVQPDEGFSLTIESKVPGHDVALQPVAMDYSYGTTLNELPFSAYETVLVDAMEGDMTLFTRGDQAEEAWRIVAPVLEAWAERPQRDISIYEAGSWGPEAADALMARDGHSWRQPTKGDGT
ncbi:MAG TPA: glucose-6-phosphate dehydrogenase [Thermoleophilia bacterium]|nr:glucose-6-phosphate dehydrogenase [Thermoleophilia bacterium]HQF53095.1 glucose-6-phosphate dehydrogenase [Thermoleophilia bacterium]HQJ26989.1 glucose-6-phosphate dehydrogenase [Thermoleophilia bacterium]